MNVHRMTSMLKCLPVLSLTVASFLLGVPTAGEATGTFITINLPKGVSIEIPKNWVVLSNNQVTTLDTFTESLMDLSGIEQIGSELPFAANLHDDSSTVIALVNVRYYPELELTQQEARSATNDDVQAFDAELRETMQKEMKRALNVTVNWQGTTKTTINGITAFVSEYSRPSLTGTGSFRVRLVRVLAGDRSFTLTTSYLDSMSIVLRPILDRIIASLSLSGTPVSGSPGAGLAVGEPRVGSSVPSGSTKSQPGQDLLVSAVVVLGIGFIPPIVVRVLAKRPLKKPSAIGVAVAFWLFNVVLFSALGGHSRSNIAAFAIAYFSYHIMTQPSKQRTADMT